MSKPNANSGPNQDPEEQNQLDLSETDSINRPEENRGDDLSNNVLLIEDQDPTQKPPNPAITFVSAIRPLHVPFETRKNVQYITSLAPFFVTILFLTTVVAPLLWLSLLPIGFLQPWRFQFNDQYLLPVLLSISPSLLWSMASSTCLLIKKQSTDHKLWISRVGLWVGIVIHGFFAIAMLVLQPLSILLLLAIIPVSMIAWILVALRYWIGKKMTVAALLKVVTLISVILAAFTMPNFRIFLNGGIAFALFSIAATAPATSLISMAAMTKLANDEAKDKGLIFRYQTPFFIGTVFVGTVCLCLLSGALLYFVVSPLIFGVDVV